MLSAKYQTEQTELAERIETLKGAMEDARQSASDAEKWVGLIRQYSDITELDVPLLNTLIKRSSSTRV